MYVWLALSHRSVPWEAMMPDYNTGQKKVSFTTEWSSPTWQTKNGLTPNFTDQNTIERDKGHDNEEVVKRVMHLPAEDAAEDESARWKGRCGHHHEAKVQSENRIQVKTSQLGNHFEQRSLTKKASKEFKMSRMCLKGKWDAQQRRAYGWVSQKSSFLATGCQEECGPEHSPTQSCWLPQDSTISTWGMKLSTGWHQTSQKKKKIRQNRGIIRCTQAGCQICISLFSKINGEHFRLWFHNYNKWPIYCWSQKEYMMIH